MSGLTITCPNAQCRATLKLANPPAPGGRVRCPRCGTTFAPAAAAPAAGVIALAPEPERPCPSCGAALAAQAILCVNCGFNLRTGEKRAGPRQVPGKRR